MVMIGNKLDLDAERAVSQDEGRKLAEEFGCPWMETSAKARIRVEDAFYELVREIRKDQASNPARAAPKKKKNKGGCSLL